MEQAFLFVYGTLLDANNEYALYLKSNSSFYSDGKVKGKLYDIGDYPGAVLEDGDSFIYGSILKIGNPEKVFSVINDYEGFGNGQVQPNEFIKIRTKIETDTGIIDCWIYLYNLPVTGLPYIQDGRYIK